MQHKPYDYGRVLKGMGEEGALFLRPGRTSGAMFVARVRPPLGKLRQCVWMEVSRESARENLLL